MTLIVAMLLAPGCSARAAEPVKAEPKEKVRVLLTMDGSHEWAAKEPIFMSLVKKAGDFEVAKSDNLDDWLPERIKNYDLVGIHSASDSFKNSDRYGQLIGGRFSGHAHGTFTVEVVDKWHPITVGLKEFEITDEDYQHAYHPEADIHVIARKKGDDRNMAWVKHVGKGRLVYLANGHGVAAFKTPGFQKLLVNAMYWVARRPVPGSGYIALFDGTDLQHWRRAITSRHGSLRMASWSTNPASTGRFKRSGCSTIS